MNYPSLTSPCHSRHRRVVGFTLIEVLVVVAIIAILAALAFASAPSFRQRGQMAASLSNLRQIGVGFQLYANDNDFALPRRTTGDEDRWPRLLLEYLGNDPKVYAEPADPNNYLRQKTDPLSNSRNHTSYIMNGYNDVGAFEDPLVTVKTNVMDKPSQTILAATQSGSGNFYMDFAEGNNTQVLNKTVYGDGSTYLFADGSSRYIKEADYDDKLWLIFKDSDIP